MATTKTTKAGKNAKKDGASKVTLTLQKTKDTKNFVRYDAEDDDAVVKSIYVGNDFAGDAESITLTLEK